MAEVLQGAVRSQAHVVVEAGTGSGKTVVALAAALQEAQAAGARVLYATRTNSQQAHVMAEFRRVREASGLPLVGVALQGRRNLCLRLDEEPALAEADAEEFGRMCRDRRQAAELRVLGMARSDPGPGLRPACAPCPYFEAALRQGTLEVERWAQEEAPTAEELARRCAALGLCPDHVVRLLLQDASLVVCPYPYLLHPGLRAALQRGLRAGLEDCVVVLDEAHNVPDAARELWSRSLEVGHCDAALGEAEREGDPVCQGLRASEVVRALRRATRGLCEEYLLEEDGPVPEGELEARLLEDLGCASPRLAQAVRGLQEHGHRIREQRRQEGKLPRSWLGACADFLAHWSEAGEEGWVKLVEGDPPRITCALLDASLATRPLLEARATLHLSGTLAPLEAYRDAVGLPGNTPLRRVATLPGEGQRRAYFATDVTTRHEDLQASPGMVGRIAARIAELLALGRATMVCFPSHDLLDRMLPLLPRGLAVERPGMGQAELMGLVQDVQEGRVRALAAVMGGRMAEGLDFPGRLDLVVVVGLPYPKPSFRTRALVQHFDALCGRGWDYAVEAPAARKVAQAAGRLLRGPRDRGVVVVLDRRATRLVPLLPDLEPSAMVARDAARFWESAPAGPIP